MSKKKKVDYSALTSNEVKQFKEAFAVFDTNSDGIISFQDLGAVMRSLGQTPTDAELKDVILEINTDGIGNLDLNEFLALMAAQTKGVDPQTELMQTFKLFDSDNDGFIHAKELQKALLNLGEKLTDEEAEEMIKEADLDGDGKVNFKEFMAMMNTEN